MHVGPETEERNYFMPTENGNIIIDKVSDEKDLGVTIDNKLNFRKHISSKVSIANRNLGTCIIFRTL